MTNQRNVAAAIIEQLNAWGVKNVYGLVGDDIFYLMDAMAKQDNISFYHVKHEETAALMASAQAKLTGQPGVCMADGGPGTLHLLNGLADACADNVPVLAITGQVNRRDIGTNAKQYIDQQSLLRPLVSYTALLCDPAGTSQVMENAYRPAVAGRSVAHISVPMDVLPLPCDAGVIPFAPYMDTHPMSSPEVVEGALRLMASACRPVILAGAGGRRAGDQLSEISLRWGAAIVNTLPGTGVVDESHPHYVGGLGHAGSPAAAGLLSRADLCLVVGANWWPQQYVPGNIPIVQIDINPANIGAAMPVAYGLVGDAADILSLLSEGMQNATPDPAWLEAMRKEIKNWLTALDQEASIQGSPVHPAALIRALQNNVSEDAIVCLDTGDNTAWFGRIFRAKKQRVLVSGKWRTMGFGLPAALAAKINRPRHQVVALVGDGGFAMTMADFLTAVKYNLAVTVVVMNNGSLAMERNKMAAGGLIPEGTKIHNPDFAGYAENCGGLGYRVENSGELDKTLRRALSAGRPAVVDIITAGLSVPGTTMPS